MGNLKFAPAVLLIFVVNIAVSQYQTETGFLKHDGYERNYEVFVPDKYISAKKYPLVFILHGGGGTAKGLVKNTRARFNYLSNRDGFIAVYPNGIEKSWNDGARDTIGVARKYKIDDVGFIEKMIDHLDQKFSIDRECVFVCGISNGGFMAQRLAYEMPDKIKGIGVVAANLSVDQAAKDYPKTPVSAVFIHGTHDPLVPFDGGHVKVFRQKRGEVKSAEQTIETWKEINGCSQNKGKFYFQDTNKKDGCTASKTIWLNPANPGIKTVSVIVENGGHTWPGAGQNLPVRLVGRTNRDFNGCDEIWDFFKSLIHSNQN